MRLNDGSFSVSISDGFSYVILIGCRCRCLGGGKIWECTQDLGDFLTRSAGDGEDDNEDTDDPAADEDAKSLFGDLNGQTVLDLGCGAGILGLLALRAGATVHFQDYVSMGSVARDLIYILMIWFLVHRIPRSLRRSLFRMRCSTRSATHNHNTLASRDSLPATGPTTCRWMVRSLTSFSPARRFTIPRITIKSSKHSAESLSRAQV